MCLPGMGGTTKRPTRELVRTWPATWRRNICQVGFGWKIQRTSRCYELKVNNRCVVQRISFVGKNVVIYDDFLRMIEFFLPSREVTYPPKMAYLKMIFLFPRWDRLVPRRVLFMSILFICLELRAETRFGSPGDVPRPHARCMLEVLDSLQPRKKERSSGGGEILRVQDWYNQVVFSSKIRILTGLIW